jgi:hypothetical protein
MYSFLNLALGVDGGSRTYSVTASAPGYFSQTKEATIFCGGTITLDFAGPETAWGTITGAVTDATTGLPVVGAFVGSTFGGSATTDEQGEYTLTNAPLGSANSPRTWEVTVIAAGYVTQTKSVEVSANETSILDFSLLKPTATITFAQAGVGTDFAGTVITIDGIEYGTGDFPVTFEWDIGSSHTFSYASPLVAGGIRYVWSSTTGLSSLQGGTLIVATSGSVTGSYLTIVERLPATVDFDPDTLNLKSKGNYVTVYIELPRGYLVTQIDISSIRLNGTVPALAKPKAIGDYDKDGIPDLMVKFDRAAVQKILAPGNQVEITIMGKVAGVDFEGGDTIRVIKEGGIATAGVSGDIPYPGYVVAGLLGCFIIAAGMFTFLMWGRPLPRRDQQPV